MNIFELHNQLNYFTKKDPNRLSLKLIKELTCSYMRECEPLYFDVFGYLGDRKFFEFPKTDNSDVLKTCLERAKSLPNIKLMWSGGIDSTFILACYKATGTPLKVYHYENRDNYTSPRLKRYISKNFDLTIMKTPQEARLVGPAYLGSLADCFFFSHQRLRGTFRAVKVPEQHGKLIYEPIFHDLPYVPLQDLMAKLVSHEGINITKRVFTDDEIYRVLEYAKVFGAPLDTNNRIARFLCFTCSLAKQAFSWSGPFYHGLDSFFLTQKFIDIAYTQYWDSNDKPWLHDKKMFKDFIKSTFGSDFGVEKNYF